MASAFACSALMPPVDGCQNPRKDGAAKKVGMALAFISAAPCSRTLGGKRWLGDKPCQGRQPPEAGAAGPPLQGLPPSHTRLPRSTADPRDAASSAIYARIHAAGNTPEGSQLCVQPTGERWRCGQQASFALTDRIGRAAVTCQSRDLDRYGRVVSVCFKGSEDLNRWMVANGWAVAYKRYSLDYVTDEAGARRSRINIWSGSFDMPWDWRAHHNRRSR